MELLTKRKGLKCELREGIKIPKDYCFYILQLGDPAERYYKIGMTDNLTRRMYEHLGNKSYDNREITVLFAKPCASKYAAERIEDNVREYLKELGFEYKRNDRFIIPEEVDKIIVKVKKEWVVNL